MKITQDNSGSEALEKLADQIKKSKREVGFFESATYPDGTPVAYVAAIQEFGNPAGNNPSRPFFRNAISQNDGWKPLATKAMSAVVEGRIELNQALNQMGLKMAADVKDSITDGSYEPLSNITLLLRQLRKSGGTVTGKSVGNAARAAAFLPSEGVAESLGVASKPLIDTAQMLQSVTYAVNGKME